MKRAFSLLVLAFTLSATASFALDKNLCVMTVQDQRHMILNEGPKSLEKPGTLCFEKLVASESKRLKQAGNSFAENRTAVIEMLMASAIKGEVFENELFTNENQ